MTEGTEDRLPANRQTAPEEQPRSDYGLSHVGLSRYLNIESLGHLDDKALQYHLDLCRDIGVGLHMQLGDLANELASLDAQDVRAMYKLAARDLRVRCEIIKNEVFAEKLRSGEYWVLFEDHEVPNGTENWEFSQRKPIEFRGDKRVKLVVAVSRKESPDYFRLHEASRTRAHWAKLIDVEEWNRQPLEIRKELILKHFAAKDEMAVMARRFREAGRKPTVEEAARYDRLRKALLPTLLAPDRNTYQARGMGLPNRDKRLTPKKE